MFDALAYALRFLVLSTALSMLTWIVVGGLTNSELTTGVAIAILNAFVLFSTVARFVDYKLDRHEFDAG